MEPRFDYFRECALMDMAMEEYSVAWPFFLGTWIIGVIACMKLGYLSTPISLKLDITE